MTAIAGCTHDACVPAEDGRRSIGRIVGVWGQRRDGGVVYGSFEPVGSDEQTLLAQEVRRLEDLLGGEFIPPCSQTPYARAFGRGPGISAAAP